ncbi:hypothetical protein [Sideroxydans sp. CL21]|nr:hypothetical protein [Sideroxydans sp. CL21]
MQRTENNEDDTRLPDAQPDIPFLRILLLLRKNVDYLYP